MRHHAGTTIANLGGTRCDFQSHLFMGQPFTCRPKCRSARQPQQARPGIVSFLIVFQPTDEESLPAGVALC